MPLEDVNKMNPILQKTISVLSKQETINYKLYANRIEHNEEQKSVLLFDTLKNNLNKDIHKDFIIEKIYGTTQVNSNTYNKLNARLLNEIDNSLVQFYFHETDATFIHSELSLYHIFLEKNDKQLAYHHLQKAEKKAIDTNQYALLDIIYNELASLSVYNGNTAPDEFVKKRQTNFKQLMAIRQLDDALNSIVYDLTKSQAIDGTSAKKLQTLHKAITLFTNKKEFKQNPLFKGKLYLAVCQVFISKKDFVTLEKYSLKTYQEFQAKKYFSKHNHSVKLQMLRYICNCLYVSKKYTLALQYAEVLNTALQEYNGLLYEQNVFFYYTILANNYSVLNPQKVIEVLTEAKNIPVISNHQTHIGFVYVNLAGAYLSVKKHKVALKNIVNLYNHSSYQHLSIGMQLQVHVIELLIRLESHTELESSKKLIISIEKTFTKTLHKKEHLCDAGFLQFMKQLVKKHGFKLNPKSLLFTNNYLEKGINASAGAVVDYKHWLKTEFLKEKVL